MATIGSETIQVEALNNNSIVIGGETFVRFTASGKDVVDGDGNKVVMNPDNIICIVEDGVPTTTNYEVIDPVQEIPYIDHNFFLEGIPYIDENTKQIFYEQRAGVYTPYTLNNGEYIYLSNDPITVPSDKPEFTLYKIVSQTSDIVYTKSDKSKYAVWGYQNERPTEFRVYGLSVENISSLTSGREIVYGNYA
jgi:hypothetical protein